MALTVDNTQQGARVGQVYWRGADGNVYLKGAGGNGAAVTNLGSGASTADLILNGAVEIADPGNPKPAGNNGLVATGGGSSAPTYKDTTASRNATQLSLDSTGVVLNNALTGADQEYTNVTNQYNTEDAENLVKYQGDVEGNEISRDENVYKGLLAAAKGSRGLYATLASLGALNGTGRTLANRAVATEANEDIGTSEKSFKTNAETLSETRGELEKKEKQRRLDAEKTWKDTRQKAEYDNLEANQRLSSEMATHWRDAGNFGEADNWTNRASSFTPQLANKTKVNPAQYAKTSLTYGKPELAKYLGGMNSTAVNVAEGNPINGAIYTSTSKKDKELV